MNKFPLFRDILREKCPPDERFFHQITHRNAVTQSGIHTDKFVWPWAVCTTSKTHTTHASSLHVHSVFPFKRNTFLLTLTIRFALAGFYPSPWGHNSIKYTIALCDTLSFLMNVSPRRPLTAQSMSFGASLMPSISHSDNSAFHLKWGTDTSIFKALIKFKIRSAAGKSEQWCAAVPIYIGGNQLPHIFCSEN